MVNVNCVAVLRAKSIGVKEAIWGVKHLLTDPEI